MFICHFAAKKHCPCGVRKAGEKNGCCLVAAFLLFVIGLLLLNGELGLPPSSVVVFRDTSDSEILYPQDYLVLYNEKCCKRQSPKLKITINNLVEITCECVWARFPSNPDLLLSVG